MIVRSEMPGTVVAVGVEPGSAVTVGDQLLVLESMKMEIPVMAPTAGAVTAVAVAVGDLVTVGHELVSIEEP